ncbi:MAG: hypothetical protein JW863_19145 [Chitinispirillaceae bacterium]|nr:hypothetical protein [Chitinispirillaceae bacterium]
MIPVRGTAGSVAVFFLSCAATLVPPGDSDGTKAVPSLHPYCSADSITVFGKISASNNGEKVTGAIEVRYYGIDAFKMVFYSPFGAIVGTVSSFNDSLVMKFGSHHRVVALSDPFPSDLLPWGGTLPCGELIRALCGGILYCDSVVNFRPTEIIESFFRTSCVWQTPEWNFTAVLSRWKHRLKQVDLEKKVSDIVVYRVRYTSFSDNTARLIAIKTDDRNYFSIEYENLR